MSKQIGLVTRIPPKGLTEVLTERRDACGGCQTTHGCHTCLSASKIKARVHNPIGARPGDVVEIYMHHRAIWQGAVILYGFPLMGLIFGAVAGAHFGAKWFGDESTAAVLAGLLGLAAGLVIAVAAGNSRYAKKYLVPTITKVIDRDHDTGGLNFSA